MVDFSLLLLLPGAGDELQGIKKASSKWLMTFLSKSSGENRRRAEQARLEQQASLSFLQPATPGWTTEAALVFCPDRRRVLPSLGTHGTFFPRIAVQRRHRQPPSTTDPFQGFTDLIRDELQRRFDYLTRVSRPASRTSGILAARRNHRRFRRAPSVGGVRCSPENSDYDKAS